MVNLVMTGRGSATGATRWRGWADQTRPASPATSDTPPVGPGAPAVRASVHGLGLPDGVTACHFLPGRPGAYCVTSSSSAGSPTAPTRISTTYPRPERRAHHRNAPGTVRTMQQSRRSLGLRASVTRDICDAHRAPIPDASTSARLGSDSRRFRVRFKHRGDRHASRRASGARLPTLLGQPDVVAVSMTTRYLTSPATTRYRMPHPLAGCLQGASSPGWSR